MFDLAGKCNMQRSMTKYMQAFTVETTITKFKPLVMPMKSEVGNIPVAS